LCERKIVKKFLKWLGFVVLGVIVLFIGALAYVQFASERAFAREFRVTETLSVSTPTDPAEIAEGQRLAQITGCTHCHGADLATPEPVDIPGIARFVPPNIASTLPDMTDAQLVGVLRRGVKPDGRGVWLMPSEMYRHLHDDDLARIIGWVRTVPRNDRATEKTKVHLMGRALVVAGVFKSGAQQIDEAAVAEVPPGRGAYLVMNACSECHGQDLNGRPEAKAPSLSVAKSYSAEQFARLMHEGIGIGDRQFELMTPTAKVRFSHLTPDEVNAVYEFLQARFEKT
jgi:cytochrome c553